LYYSRRNESRWFVFGASGAILTGILAAAVMLSPAPRLLAQQELTRITSAISAAHSPVTSTALASGMVIGPLNGEPTPRANATRRAIAVMIDNYFPDARPQTGIDQASLVFETMVEGGFTRIMPVYLEHDPSVVGPVRSTRIYFDDWAGALHAVLVHVGGNDDADAQLWQMPKVYNLDQGTDAFLLGYMNSYFWRDDHRTIPDNMYANIAKLRTYVAKRRQNWRYAGASLPHKLPAPAAARGGAGTLTIGYVDPLFPGMPPLSNYQVQWRYDPVSNSYLRVVGGVNDIDVASHQPIRAQNIVVMKVGAGTPDQAAGTTVDAVSLPVIGTGPALYFRDGHVQHGVWEQNDPMAPLRLMDPHGRPVKFDPGQTWVEAVPQASSTSWTFR
jgi:hypothetical protein